MKNIKDFIINESIENDINAWAPKAISTENTNGYPIFKFPDGKEYVLRLYNSDHKDNGHGPWHIGLKFVEFKN